jgi:putative ABC transport system ATP-binding protein
MIHLEDVRLQLQSRAGPVEILRGVSLDVDHGEAVAILGPSGSGKSTLLMILAGLERASSGQVKVFDRDLSAMDEDALALFRRAHVGIVFQSFHLVLSMTALENVAVPLELAGHADAHRRARLALESIGLGHRLGHYPVEMSGGEQQRVAIARAFAPRPGLILADEPTGNLDSATGEQVMEILFRLQAETGATLVLITHDERLAARCARTIRIEDGRIASDTGTDTGKDTSAVAATP